MMSQIIPGGRPRASSDGDLLDEGLCGALFVNLNDDHNSTASGRSSNGGIQSKNRFRNRFGPGKKDSNLTSVPNRSTSRLSLHNSSAASDTFESDGEISSQSQEGTSLNRFSKKRFSFKSVKRAVSRAFVRDDGTLKKGEKAKKPVDISKVWTPDLRHLGQGYYSNVNGSDYSDSRSRPLITDPSLKMSIPKWKKTPGTTGIENHGNTCYMNAVLQCLSNTDSFTEYFVQDFYKNDLKNSKAGRKGISRSSFGEVTEHCSRLLKSLWSGKYTGEISREFKMTVGKFNSQYKGEDQHDSQEFLLWLLDRIHEDVRAFNKKKIKPAKVSSLKSDEELATEAASVNGESFVLKLFQALHSSTLTCPTCGEHSSTFDPYLCVSLPLPQKNPRVFYIITVPLSQRLQKISITLNHYEGVRDLREQVAAHFAIPAKQVLLCQLKEDGFGTTFHDEQSLLDVPENASLYAFQTYSDRGSFHSDQQEFDTEMAQLLVLHLKVPGGSARNSRFGRPTMLQVPRDISWKGLQKEILLRMEDAIHKEILSQNLSLSTLFNLRMYDFSSQSTLIPPDVEMPLYTEAADRALNMWNEDYGPSHIKLIAEWEPQKKKKLVYDDSEMIQDHSSVKEAQSSPPRQGKVSLEECFRLYTQEERLSGDDAWLCPHCKQQQQGTIKSLGLWSLPDVLVLHLKRFKQTGLHRSKLNTLVDFPVDGLDMSSHLVHQQKNGHNASSAPLARDSYTYDLLGVSNHYGNMMGGHYVAFCRSPIDDVWRRFDDKEVTQLTASSVVTKDAYILFYQRRSLRKDINQKLFTGDHWVFSLPLAPEEKQGESSASSNDPSPREGVSSSQGRASHSRSLSPSSYRQINQGPATKRVVSRPLTPQPSPGRVAPISSWEAEDDSRPTSPEPERHSPTRRSRSLHRQTSEPSGQPRRSAGSRTVSQTNKEPSRYQKAEPRDIGLDPAKNVSAVSASTISGKSLTLPGKLKSHIGSSHPHNGLSTNAAMNEHVPSRSLMSDDKYPSRYDTSRFTDRKNGHLSEYSDNFHEPVSLCVNLDNYESKLAKHLNSSDVYGSDSARRKLAQVIRQSSLEKALAERPPSPDINTIEEEDDIRGSHSTSPRHYSTQTSYHQAKQNLIDMDYSDMNDVLNGFRSLDVDNLITTKKRRSNVLPALSHSEDYIFHGPSSLDSNVSRTKLSSRLPAQGFSDLAEKYFGRSGKTQTQTSNKDKFLSAQEREYMTRNLNGDLSRLNNIKSATIASPRLSSQINNGIHRSTTDHSISYESTEGLGPPPSPTPPQSQREESFISASDQLSERDFLSIHSSDPLEESRGSGSRSGYGMPGYVSRKNSRYQPRPHRGIWGVVPQKRKSLPGVPTPCLRESSV